jgi:hypothetical protein
MNKDEILRQGFVIVKVTVAGIRQTHRLDVVKEKGSNGFFHYLTGRFTIPEAEMIRLAEELQLPIRSKDVLVFPKGKSRKDFTEINIVPDTIEAEIE